MREPLKAGDRVRVYGPVADRKHNHTAVSHDFVGTVKNATQAPDFLIVTSDYDSGEKFCHPKQCRRLIKKERRRVWLDPRWVDGEVIVDGRAVAYTGKVDQPAHMVEFVEVRKK